MKARTLLATVAAIGLAASVVAQDTPPPRPVDDSTPRTDRPQTPDTSTPSTTPSPSGLGSGTATQPQPSTTGTQGQPGTTAQPGVQPQTGTTPMTPNPTVSGSGMAYPSGPVYYPNIGWVYPQGTVPGGVVQSGYTQPMTFFPQNQTYYQQGQVLPAGYTQQGATVYGSTPVVSGTTLPSTGFVYPSSGYAYPSFGNGYANMGTYTGGAVSNVVSTPTRAVRRLFRR